MKLGAVLALAILSGCSVGYISSDVSAVSKAAPGEQLVEVVPLTAASAKIANQSPFTPRSLPKVFRAVSRLPSPRSAGPMPKSVTTKKAVPGPLETRAPPPIEVAPYTIGISDVLELSIPTATDAVGKLSGLLTLQGRRQIYTVGDDGAISVPDVGRIMVAGRTLDEADAAVFKALVAAQINPTFSVEIKQFNSQRVSVGGAVARPLLAPITLSPLYLEDALQLAGGVTVDDIEYASIRLYRAGKLYQIPLAELYAQAELKRVLLRDGDSIFVDTTFELDQAQAYFEEQIKLKSLRQTARREALAALSTEFGLRQAQSNEARANFEAREQLGAIGRDYVYISGEVREPGRFALPFEQRAVMADALFSNKGLSSREADPTQIYLLRASSDGSKVTAYHLNARNAAAITLATMLELRPNDVLFVAEQPVTRWNRLFDQILPSLISTATQKI